jgi:GST-like protein
MRLWVEWCNSQFVLPIIGVLYENRKAQAERSQEKIDRNKAKLNELLPRLERQLQTHEFLLGSYGMADIAFTPFLALCERIGVDFSGFPQVARWAQRLKSRDSYEEVKIGFTA